MTGTTERVFITRFHALTADMPLDEKVATVADLFIREYAGYISPIVRFESELFGSIYPAVGQDKVIVLEGAVQAASEMWSLTPESHFAATRLANQAIDQALRLIRSDVSTDNSSLASLITKALPLIGR